MSRALIDLDNSRNLDRIKKWISFWEFGSKICTNSFLLPGKSSGVTFLELNETFKSMEDFVKLSENPSHMKFLAIH